MSLAKKPFTIDPNQRPRNTKTWLLGEPDPKRTEQIEPFPYPLDGTFKNLSGDSGSNGNPMGSVDWEYWKSLYKYFINMRQPFVIVPTGTYKPEELQIHTPEVDLIHVGHCSCKTRGTGFTIDIAHATKYYSKEGERFHEICFKHGGQIFDDLGKMQEIFLHEYAHILGGYGHDGKWAKVCHKLGTLARASVDYWIGDDPKVEWESIRSNLKYIPPKKSLFERITDKLLGEP